MRVYLKGWTKSEDRKTLKTKSRINILKRLKRKIDIFIKNKNIFNLLNNNYIYKIMIFSYE